MASCPCLSDRRKFSNFFRTIPSDVYQARAMARLAMRFHWNWIGAVAVNTDYGRLAIQVVLLIFSFWILHIEWKCAESFICIMFTRWKVKYMTTTSFKGVPERNTGQRSVFGIHWNVQQRNNCDRCQTGSAHDRIFHCQRDSHIFLVYWRQDNNSGAGKKKCEQAVFSFY